MLRRLVLLAGWCGAAYLVHAAYVMATGFAGQRAVAFVLYALGLGAMFPLQASTRGPLSRSVAFGACWALVVEGLRFAVVAEEPSLAVTVLLAVPLVALIVRCSSIDASDGWFARRRSWVLPLALSLAAPPLFVGLLGARQADPAPYQRALRRFGSAGEPMQPPPGLPFAPKQAGRFDWAGFEAARSDVAPEVRADVERACGALASNERARGDCAYDHLVSRAGSLDRRRRVFRISALVSALPAGIALLFAWRGRRRASGVHARPTE